MSIPGNAGRSGGTRFLLYPQSPALSAVRHPERVLLGLPPGTIGPGPRDDRMYVVDPAEPKEPYEFPRLPPFDGPARPPVEPGPGGHFDHLALDSREFRAAHMYGTLRFVLDVWEGYFGHRIPWHFLADLPLLELVPSLDWDNAHSGYGFLEAGIDRPESGGIHYYALNFDVLAHELGHSILYSQIGTPSLETLTSEYLALHESCADVIALVTALHFPSVVRRLLDGTRGNLYVLNELNRIAETSDHEQIRIASNGLKMSDVADAWNRLPASCDEHELGQPVTGALFDILVDVFLGRLADGGAVPAWLADASRLAPEESVDYAAVEREFARAYAHGPHRFEEALLAARDYLGRCLAYAWGTLDAVVLSFSELYRALLAADAVLARGAHRDVISECFEWRGIGITGTRPSTAIDDSSEWPPELEGATGIPVVVQRREPYFSRVRRSLARSRGRPERERDGGPA